MKSFQMISVVAVLILIPASSINRYQPNVTSLFSVILQIWVVNNVSEKLFYFVKGRGVATWIDCDTSMGIFLARKI